MMMVSDIFCFIARLSSSDLCFSHVKLLTTLVQSKAIPNLNLAVIKVLQKRLENFLSDSDKLSTKKINESKGDVLRKWKLLKSGNYLPSSKLSSIKNVSDLVKDTCMGKFAVDQMGEIVDCMMTIQNRNTNNEDKMLFLEHLIRVLKDFQFKSFQVNQQLFNVLASMLKNKSNVTMAASHLKSIAINQNLQIPQELLLYDPSSFHSSQGGEGGQPWQPGGSAHVLLLAFRVPAHPLPPTQGDKAGPTGATRLDLSANSDGGLEGGDPHQAGNRRLRAHL